jgi:hypothetical protein
MSKKRDSVAQRLKALQEEEKFRKRAMAPLDTEFLNVGMLGDRGYRAQMATRIRRTETSLRKAFETFELDPDIPEHWHLLIDYLARSHYETKQGGAPLEWTRLRKLRLIADYKFAKELMPGASKQAIRGRMIDDCAFRARYAGMTNDGLRKQIDTANKWFQRWLSSSS